MGKLHAKLSESNILIADGAWGTFLYEKGLQAGECPEYWNLIRPSEVKDIALSYIKAGSDIIETNSFGASSIKLAHFNLAAEAYKINYEAAAISKSVAGDTGIVLGSVGPTGKILMMGDITEEEMYNSYKEQVKGLEDGGADALIIETMSDLEEARIAFKAARENTSCDIVVSFTFNKTGDDYRTMMGISPAEVMEEFSADPLTIIGSNCGNGIKDMVPVAEIMSLLANSNKIMIQANAGAPVYLDGKTVFPESPEEMIQYLPALINANVKIIGGCCGTTPAHINAFRNYIDSRIK